MNNGFRNFTEQQPDYIRVAVLDGLYVTYIHHGQMVKTLRLTYT